MQIRRETDYAIRCVLYLCGAGDKPVAVGEISDAMGIKKTFTAKILQKLVKSGLITSRKGSGGGFTIAKDPQRITLLDVIEAVEGALALNICVIDKKNCERSSFCPVHPVWFEIKSVLAESLISWDFKRIMESSELVFKSIKRREHA